jgi:hypothetical protein
LGAVPLCPVPSCAYTCLPILSWPTTPLSSQFNSDCRRASGVVCRLRARGNAGFGGTSPLIATLHGTCSSRYPHFASLQWSQSPFLFCLLFNYLHLLLQFLSKRSVKLTGAGRGREWRAEGGGRGAPSARGRRRGRCRWCTTSPGAATSSTRTSSRCRWPRRSGSISEVSGCDATSPEHLQLLYQ